MAQNTRRCNNAKHRAASDAEHRAAAALRASNAKIEAHIAEIKKIKAEARRRAHAIDCGAFHAQCSAFKAQGTTRFAEQESKCCVCGDVREFTLSGTYDQYVDGTGVVQTATRYASYCPTCKAGCVAACAPQSRATNPNAATLHTAPKQKHDK